MHTLKAHVQTKSKENTPSSGSPKMSWNCTCKEKEIKHDI